MVILQEAELGHSVVSSICERYLASSKSAAAEDKLFDHREWFKQKQMMLQYVQLCCAEVGLGLEAANERMDKVNIQLAAKLCNPINEHNPVCAPAVRRAQSLIESTYTTKRWSY